MTPSHDEVARIAAKLTKAQREVIHNAWAYPDYHRQGEQVSYCPVQINARNGEALERLKLAAMKADGGPRLTDLGLAVRSLLLEKGEGA